MKKRCRAGVGPLTPHRHCSAPQNLSRANTEAAVLLGRSVFCWMTTVFHNICLLRRIIKAITCTPPLTSSHMLTQAISQGVNLAAKSRRRNTHSETICHHSPTLLFKLVPIWNSSALEKKKRRRNNQGSVITLNWFSVLLRCTTGCWGDLFQTSLQRRAELPRQGSHAQWGF